MTSDHTHWSSIPAADMAARIRSWAIDVAADDSPLYRILGQGAAEDPDLVAMIAEAPRNQPAPLLFMAAVHAVVADNPDEALAAWYPSVSGHEMAGGDPAPAFRDFCLRYRAELVHLVRTRRVQTNEVGRCALLLPAFQVVASMAALPLAIIEVGCSAGLNLRFDDYRYHYKSAAGTVVAGRAGSDVAIDCRLVGEIPPLLETTPSVVSRVGLELNPVDVTDSSDEAWIRALIWPDQPERHRRLAAALQRAATDPPPIVAGDALTDLAPLAAGLPTEAAVCVVHTHVVNQLSPAGRQAFDDVLRTLSQGRPVYRIASEWLRTPAPVLDLTVYDQGTGSNIPLGTADKHGAWLDWFGVE